MTDLSPYVLMNNAVPGLGSDNIPVKRFNGEKPVRRRVTVTVLIFSIICLSSHHHQISLTN